MDFVLGLPLHDRWRSISWPTKKAIAEQLAVYCASMYSKQFGAIGDTYPTQIKPIFDADELGRLYQCTSSGTTMFLKTFLADRLTQAEIGLRRACYSVMQTP